MHEYKKIVSGDYNTYQYRCTRETYIEGLENEAEAYRSQPMRNTRKVSKNKKSIKDFSDSEVCMSLTTIKAFANSSSTKSKIAKKTKQDTDSEVTDSDASVSEVSDAGETDSEEEIDAL